VIKAALKILYSSILIFLLWYLLLNHVHGYYGWGLVITWLLLPRWGTDGKETKIEEI